VPLVAAVRLSKLFVAARDIEDVVDDLEQNTQLLREAPVRDCLRFAHAAERQHDAHARGNEAARLQRVEAAKGIRLCPRRPRARLFHRDVYVLATHHAVDADRGEQLRQGGQNRRRLALLLLAEQADRLREEAVAGEDGHVLAVDDVRGRAAAAQLVVVHRGEVVVDQGVGVNEL
jgi:hypothetical protein